MADDRLSKLASARASRATQVARPSLVERGLRLVYVSFCRLIFKFWCPVQIRGREHLPARPFILCANHSSHMDTPLLMYSAGGSFDDYAMVAARDYFFSATKISRFWALCMNLVPVERRASRASLRDMIAGCQHSIDQRKNLIIYPEGTRSSGGSIGQFKRGIGILAQALALPVVPARVEGTYQRLPKGAVAPRPGKVSVCFAPPLSFTDYPNSAAFTSAVQEAVENSSFIEE